MSQANPSAVVAPAAPQRTLGWVVKRALFGLVLVVVVSTGAAVLMSAGLDPSEMSDSE